MKRLMRFYTPWLGAIVAAIALLFAQANLDLALPDYLSRIVNVGIQQRGIESPIPEQMRAETWEAVLQIAAAGVGAETGVQGSDLASLYVPAGAASDAPASVVLSDEGRARLAGDIGESDGASGEALQTALITAFVQAASGGMAGGMAGGVADDPATLDQVAIRLIALEYEALGLDPQAIQTAYIWRMGATMMLLTLLSAMATISVSYIGARVSAGVARSVRSSLFRTVESFSAAEIDQFSTASLITRSTNDITQVQTVTFMIIRMVFLAPIMGVGGVVRALGKAPSMAWMIGIAVLVLLGLVLVVMALALPKFKAIQALTDRLNRVAREQLSGIMVVRAFNRQEFEERRFDAANVDLTATNLFVMRVMVVMMPLIMLVMNVLSVAIIRVGADRIAASAMQVGDMMAFLQYAMQIVMSFLMLTMVFVMVPRASVSANRIADVLETEPTIRDPEEPARPVIPAGSARGRVEFRNVTFAYPGADDNALEGISFVAEPGTTTAVIGSTGSGKSSLVNLIPRFYDVCAGEILIDGLDIRRLTLSDLRERIGYVPQQSALFTGTIASNLRYGNESATADELRTVAETAQALGFIEEREDGFEAAISQGGTNVSGGQRQRLSIARALAGRPSILVLDDSFSALDVRTDAALRRALGTFAGETTRIIVAQRVSTIIRAEQIVVLEDGRVAGIGTHGELMANCPEYREIVLSQMSIEEAS